MTDKAATVGELREAGYRAKSVREEMRDNLIGRLGSGEALFPGDSGV